MPTFKPKSSKTIQVCSHTLDSKHRELIESIGAMKPKHC